MEIALAISLMLFDVVVTQGYTYFQTCENDRMSLKALVRLFFLINIDSLTNV
jgi:hypothetical protein